MGERVNTWLSIGFHLREIRETLGFWIYQWVLMSASLLKLSDSPKGFKGIIRGFSGDSEMKRRLLEMGFYEGAQVIVKSRMPFGGPLVVEVDHFSMAIRKFEADAVLLEAR